MAKVETKIEWINEPDAETLDLIKSSRLRNSGNDIEIGEMLKVADQTGEKSGRNILAAVNSLRKKN